MAHTNYRIYGNQFEKGWVKITTVEKKEYIQSILNDMSDLEIFSQYIIIRHNFDIDCDEPYDIGNFDSSIKKYRKLMKFDKK